MKILPYWNHSLSLIKKLEKDFLSPLRRILFKNLNGLNLLQSFGQLTTLWLYHKRFLEGRNWLNTDVIQHTQYFISYALDLVRLTLKKSE